MIEKDTMAKPVVQKEERVKRRNKSKCEVNGQRERQRKKNAYWLCVQMNSQDNIMNCH